MLSQNDFVDRIETSHPYIKVTGKYRGMTRKVELTCRLCGHIWNARAESIKKETKCPACKFRNRYTYKTSIFYTHPDLIKIMYNPFDAERYSHGSRATIKWVCPDCGNIITQSISKVITRGLSCKKCGDGYSYPNKFMYQILDSLNVEFIAEYSPDWIFPKRYDFYLPKHKLIIEMDGGIGHGNKSFNGGISTKDTDNYKDSMAKEHDLLVVRIDCLQSEFDYILKNILNSPISKVFDLSNVDFKKCHINSCRSLKIRACNLWNESHDMQTVLRETKLSRKTIIRYLSDCAKNGLCDYDPHKQKAESGNRNIVKAYTKNRKMVVCIQTGEVFKSIREANQWLGYHIDSHSIQDNCKGI